jgi:hypothetical protein
MISKLILSLFISQEQTTKIKEKKALVMEDLAQVEPAVQDAKQGKIIWPHDLLLCQNS